MLYKFYVSFRIYTYQLLKSIDFIYFSLYPIYPSYVFNYISKLSENFFYKKSHELRIIIILYMSK